MCEFIQYLLVQDIYCKFNIIFAPLKLHILCTKIVQNTSPSHPQQNHNQTNNTNSNQQRNQLTIHRHSCIGLSMRNNNKNKDKKKININVQVNKKYQQIQKQLNMMHDQFNNDAVVGADNNKTKKINKNNNGKKLSNRSNKLQSQQQQQQIQNQSFQNFIQQLNKKGLKTSDINDLPDLDMDQLKKTKSNKPKCKGAKKPKCPTQQILNHKLAKIQQEYQPKTQVQKTSHIAQAVLSYIKQQKKEQVCKQIQGKDPLRLYHQKLIDYVQFPNLLPTPQKPITPYMLFHIEKASEIKMKKLEAVQMASYLNLSADSQNFLGSILDQQKFEQFIQENNMNASINSLWNTLSIQQKDRYYLQYQNKLHKYNILLQQQSLLSKKKKIPKPYNRFYKHQYGMLQIQRKYSLAQITNIIKQKWKNISAEEKQIYQSEEREEREQMEAIQSDEKLMRERIAVYIQKLAAYGKDIQMWRKEVMQKFGFGDMDMGTGIKERTEGQNHNDDEAAQAKQEFMEKMQVNSKLLMNYYSKLQRKRKKQRQQQLRKKRLQQNLKKLEQIKNKQIWQIKLMKYQSQGIPRDIFLPYQQTLKTPQKAPITPNSSNKKAKKISNTSTIQSNYSQPSHQPGNLNFNQIQLPRDAAPKTSSFRTMRLFMEMEKKMGMYDEHQEEEGQEEPNQNGEFKDNMMIMGEKNKQVQIQMDQQNQIFMECESQSAGIDNKKSELDMQITLKDIFD